MDCSLPGSLVHGIFQARVLEWLAIAFPRRSSRSRDQTQVSLTAGRLFIIWATREAQKKAEATLKQALTQAPALRLLDPEKEFQLYVQKKEGIALGILTQRLGPEPQPVAYLSKRLYPTAWGWPPCLWNPAVIAILIEDASKLSFEGKVTILISHQVKQLLNERGHLWISDQRMLRYQVVLMENPGLTISPCEVLNPATLLPTPEGSLPFHSCLETLDHWTKPWEVLSEDPLTNPQEIWYTDGSSFVLDGKRRARYAVVSNFWDHRCFDTSYVSSIAWAHSPNSSFRAGERKKSSHLHWLQVCLSGATCTCCYLERNRPLDHPRVPSIISLGSWRQSICLLRFQSPTVKDTIKGARKWHKGPNQAAKRAVLQNNDLIGVATLLPQTNLP